jgi:uncharacterized protein (TIGR00297 family)
MYDYIGILLILLTGMLLSIYFRKLTVPAAITGGIIGVLVFTGAGFTGIVMMAAFFILGSAATSWKIKTKHQLGLAETNKGRRTATQVTANAGVAAILGLLASLYPQQKDVLHLMMAAAFSSATADTLSSELGNICGSKFYNIITFKKDQRGLNGVVSLEGILLGLAGSMIIGIIYTTGLEWDITNALIVIIAGTTGNLSDSFLGATLERNQFLKNNAVNFMNTCAAAITGLFLYLLLH